MSTHSFVDQLYIRFLGRPADAGGLAFWTKMMDEGRANAAQVTQHFLDSPEFANAVQPLARLYYTAFGRIPDAGGLSFWLQQAQAGVPLADIAAAFTGSAEFKAAYGQLDNGAFIDALWASALNRSTDAAFKAKWLPALGEGASRADVLASLANSHEVVVLKSEAIKVIAQYHGTLGMAPSQHDINTALMHQDALGLITRLYGRADYSGAEVPGLIARGIASKPGGVVFIDRNGNGALDDNELSVLTNSEGRYSFDDHATFEGQLVALPVVVKNGGAAQAQQTADTTAPTLQGHSPANHDGNASTSTFVLTFSEAVLPNTGFIRITNGTTQTTLTGGVLQTRIVGETDFRLVSVTDAQVSIAGSVVTVNLNTPLQGNSNYSLLVDQGAFKDGANLLFAGVRDTSKISFTTTASTDTTRPQAQHAYFETGGLLGIGDSIEISVTFSEAVWGYGSPYLLLDVGNGSTRSAVLSGGSGTNTLTFTYTVQAGDTSQALALALEGGSYGYGLISQVQDAAGNFVNAGSVLLGAALGHGGPSNAPSSEKVIIVDGIAPLKTGAPVLDPGWDTGINTDKITTHGQLVFHGTGVQVGDTVDLYVVGRADPVGTSAPVTNAGNGWTIQTENLAPGTYDFYVVAKDPAGNVGEISTLNRVIIDNVALAPPNIALVNNSDTGTAGDLITKLASPFIGGTGAEPGATVELFTDILVEQELVRTSLGTATVDGTGNWQLQVDEALWSDVFTVFARQTDVAGNISGYSENLTFTVDLQAPDTPESTPDIGAGEDSGTFGNDNITSVTNPTISGTGVTAGAKVNIYVGGTLLTTVTANGNGEWSLSGHTFAESTVLSPHVITFTELDVAGNESGASDPLNLVIDTTAPLAATNLDLDVESDLGTSLTDNQTADATPTIRGNAETGATVTLKNGNDVIGTTTVANGSWSITPTSALANGDYNFTATVTDKAGNTSVASAPLAVKVHKVTLSVPTALDMVASSDLGTSNSDNETKQVRPTIQGSGAAANGTVELYANFLKVGTGIADANGDWSIQVNTDLLHGDVEFIANQVDMYGNASADSAGLTVKIDTQAPTAPTGTPTLETASNTGSTADTITKLARPTITGSGAIAGGQVGIYDCEVLVATVTANGSGVWTYTPATDLAPGNHSFEAVNIDTAGNESSKTATLVVTVDLSTPSVPAAPDMRTADDLGTSNTDNSTSIQSPHFVGSGAETGTTISLYNGTTLLGSAVVDADGNFDIVPTAAFANGTYSLTLTATDVAGNTSAASPSTSITIYNATLDTPVFPLLDGDDDLGSSSTDRITSDNTPRIYSLATPGGTVQVYEGSTLLGTATANGYGNWTATLSTLADGDHTVYAVLVDQYGNKSANSTTLTFTIDTAPPVAISTAPSIDSASDTGHSNSDAKTYDTTPTITGSGAIANGWVAVYIDGSYLGATQANGSGAYTYTIANGNALAGGVYSVTVRNIDTAGNHSATASPSLTLGIDTVAPDALGAPDMVTSDDLGTSNSDNLTSDDTPRFSGTAEAGALVELYEGTTLLGQAYADTDTQLWEITSSSLGNGTHTLTLYSTDIFGNKSVVSPSTTVDIFKTTYTAPSGLDLSSGSDTGSSNSDNETSDTTATITGNATTGATVALYEGTTFLGSATAVGYGNWTITTSALGEGDHTIVAVVQDQYGNKSPDSTSITVKVDLTAPNAPGTPTVSSALTNNPTPPMTVTAPADAVRVNFYHDGAFIGFTTTKDGSGNFVFSTATDEDYEDIEDGVHGITARAVDAAGNESVDSPTLTLTIDTVFDEATPNLVASSDTGASDTDNITNAATPQLSGGGLMPNSADAFIWINGDDEPLTVDANGNWTYGFEAGGQVYSIYVTGRDAAGNTGTSSTLTVTHDTSMAPAELGYNVNTSTALALNFGEAVYWTSGNITLTKTSGGSVNLSTANATITGNVLTLNSGYTLDDDSDYTITFPATFQDAAGNTPSALSFRADNTNVSSYSFTGNNTLTLNFSENVTFITGSVLIMSADTFTIAREITYDAINEWTAYDGDTLIFDLTGLSIGNYYVNILGSITDSQSDAVTIGIVGQSSAITFTRIAA